MHRWAVARVVPCADSGDVSGSWFRFLLPVLPAICCVWLKSHPNLRVGVRTAARIARLKTEAEGTCYILTACGHWHLSPPLFVRPFLQTGTDLGVHQTGQGDRERLNTMDEPPLRSMMIARAPVHGMRSVRPLTMRSSLSTS